jgi:hypothetical protein
MRVCAKHLRVQGNTIWGVLTLRCCFIIDESDLVFTGLIHKQSTFEQSSELENNCTPHGPADSQFQSELEYF